MSESATETLCRMLDERGVEWKDGDAAYEIEWSTPDGRYCSAMYWKPTFSVLISHCTPEQAIAATLGSERELIDLAHNAWSMALCAMQGMPIPAEWGDAVERGLREHGIDVDGELAGFEVEE